MDMDFTWIEWMDFNSWIDDKKQADLDYQIKEGENDGNYRDFGGKDICKQDRGADKQVYSFEWKGFVCVERDCASAVR